MSLREEQCNKVCRILDDVLANRPTERDALITAVKIAFSALNCSEFPNNSDTISRAKAIDALRKLYITEPKINNDYSYDMALDQAEDAIKQLPPVQSERKRGKWIPVDSYSAFGGDETTWMAHGNPVAFYYCSECKQQTYAGEDGESLITDYCPNCGVDMRGEQDG